MTPVVEVRFKGNRKAYFTWPSPEPLALHDPVIVEVERGQDLGRVSAVGPVAAKKCAGACSGCSLAEAAAAPPPAPAAAPAPDPIEQLKQLGELHSQGVLTDEEFAAQKARLLG